jgi:transcriptional regulator with XRE-family HTH domain
VRFHEKLRRRVQELGLNKARAARDASLPESTISSYLSKRASLPRIDIAVKIAKALRVPVEWLGDESQDWPPPVLEPDTLFLASDHELLVEVARRFRLVAVRLYDELERAKEIDWTRIAAEILKVPLDEKIPQNLQRTARIPHTISALAEEVIRFDPSLVAIGVHDEMPGRDLDPDYLTSSYLLECNLKLPNELPGLRQVQELYRLHEMGKKAEGARRVVAAELEQLRKASKGKPAPDNLRTPPTEDYTVARSVVVLGSKRRPDRPARRVERDP